MMDKSQMLNRNYSVWPSSEDPITVQISQRPLFTAATKPGRGKWSKRNDIGDGGFETLKLNELQSQNRRRFFPKKKLVNRFAPFAPRNTTSYLIRAKKSGGICSLVSPCPVTPAVLPTPIFSPSREVLVDMAKEEWGVDGYGSMKGLIRLRSRARAEEEGGGGGSSSEIEVERRLDHDLSRFEMIYPNCGDDEIETSGGLDQDQDQEKHIDIAHVEEENLRLRGRLFLMERELELSSGRLFLVEREMEELKRRVQCLETIGRRGNHGRNINEENGSDNEGGSGDVCSEKSVSGRV